MEATRTLAPRPKCNRGSCADLITHSALGFVRLCEAARLQCYARANAVAVGPLAHQPQLQPVIAVPALVPQKLRLLAVVGDQHVDISVVIEIGECRRAAYSRRQHGRPQSRRHILELAEHVAIHRLDFLHTPCLRERLRCYPARGRWR